MFGTLHCLPECNPPKIWMSGAIIIIIIVGSHRRHRWSYSHNWNNYKILRHRHCSYQ